MRADLDRMLEVLPKANAAGVKLVLGDDYGAVGFPHGRYAHELEVYVRDAGIAPLDVLRWATVHGAELMGRGNELGRVGDGLPRRPPRGRRRSQPRHHACSRTATTSSAS